MDSIHSKLADYRPTSRHFDSHVKITLGIGATSMVMNLAFIFLLPGFAGPLYWFLGGICTGMFLIFAGAYGLKKKDSDFGRLGRKLHPNFARWFPPLQFWFRHFFLVLVFAAIWFQLINQGMPTSLAHQISILLLVLYTPFRRLINEKAVHKDTRRWDLIDEWAGFFMVTVFFIFIGMTLSQYVMPEREVSGYQQNQAPIFMTIGVWMMVSIVILSRLVLLIDRLSRKETR